MQPLSPILVVRSPTLDEGSSEHAPLVPSQGPRLSVGQFVSARVVGVVGESLLAEIGDQLIGLEMGGSAQLGDQLQLQVLSAEVPLKFRLVDLTGQTAESVAVALSDDLLAQTPSAAALHPEPQRVSWPAQPLLSGEPLRALLEAAVRQILLADRHSTDPTEPATLPPAHQPAADAPARFGAFAGWVWPEQRIEIDLDRGGRHDAMDQAMNQCVVSLRLNLPVRGRIQSVLHWATPGLRLQVRAAEESTANLMRQDSGALLDTLAAQGIRVAALTIGHD